MLIESRAFYAVSSLLVIGLWSGSSNVVFTFLPVLTETQVRPFPPPGFGRSPRRLNKNALTSNTTVTGHIGSFHARNRRESTGGSGLGLELRSISGGVAMFNSLHHLTPSVVVVVARLDWAAIPPLRTRRALPLL